MSGGESFTVSFMYQRFPFWITKDLGACGQRRSIYHTNPLHATGRLRFVHTMHRWTFWLTYPIKGAILPATVELSSGVAYHDMQIMKRCMVGDCRLLSPGRICQRNIVRRIEKISFIIVSPVRALLPHAGMGMNERPHDHASYQENYYVRSHRIF